MTELEKEIAKLKGRVKYCEDHLLEFKLGDSFSQGYVDAGNIGLKIIESLQAENQRIIENHDRIYKLECEEEAFRLKCYREELAKVEAENQQLREKLEIAEDTLKFYAEGVMKHNELSGYEAWSALGKINTKETKGENQ